VAVEIGRGTRASRREKGLDLRLGRAGQTGKTAKETRNVSDSWCCRSI